MMFPQHKARQKARQGTGHTLERAAIVLGVIWMAGVLLFAILSPPAGGTTFLTLAMTFLVVLLPLALIWLAITTLRTLRDLRAETAALQAEVEAMHHPDAPPSGSRSPASSAAPASATANPAGAAASRKAGAHSTAGPPGSMRPAPAETTASPRPSQPASGPNPMPEAGPHRGEAHDEPALALDTPDEQTSPLSAKEFIRALQFPDSPEDAEGVRALHLALEDREVARLIRAAQDVLTLLSQEGVYMDDLVPDMVRADQWRLFATGVRGETVADVGGIHDHAALALTATRMREDAIFRDAAHHFLRAFDRSFQAFERAADDDEIRGLAQTRTARAFMLFGRVAGVFD